MAESQNWKISKNGIKDLFKNDLSSKKATIKTNLTLQVVNTKLQQSGKSKTAILSDSINKYAYFVFPKEKCQVQNFDIIKITEISTSITSDKTNHVFVIKKFQILNSKQTKLIGEPNNYQHTEKKREDYQPKIPCLDLKKLNSFSNNFNVKIRVTKKVEVKHYKNAKGQGKIFSFNVIDLNGDEMQVISFNENVDRIQNIIEENKVYLISNPVVKVADKKYSNLKSEYRLVFDNETEIEELDDNKAIKSLTFNFKSLECVRELPVNTLVDVIGFVVDIGAKSVIKTRNNFEMKILKLKIADASNFQIDVSLWKEHSEISNINKNSIIAFKCLKIGEFNGKNLNTIEESQVIVEPDVPEHSEIKYFLENNFDGVVKNFGVAKVENVLDNQIDDLKTVIDAFDEYDEKSMPIFKVKARIAAFKHDEKNYYLGCPFCKKKVNEETYGFVCPSDYCGKKVEKAIYYYSFSVKIHDHMTEYWVDLFGNMAEKITKLKAEEYKSILEQNDKEKLQSMVKEIENQQFYFIMKPKNQVYNNIWKKRLNGFKIETVDKDKEISRLVGEIEKYLKA